MSNTYFIPPYWIRGDDLSVIDNGKLENKQSGWDTKLLTYPQLDLVGYAAAIKSNHAAIGSNITPP